MTWFSAIPVPETTVGIAIEAERGAPEAPKYWIPVMSPKYKPDLQLLPDEGLRGSMVKIYDEVPGLRFDSHAWDQYPYLDSFPVLLRALMGSKDNLTAVVPLTTLAVESKAPEKKIISATQLEEGLVVTLDEGTAEEEVRVLGKETKIKAGEYEYVVETLAHTHKVGGTVSGPTQLTKEAKAAATSVETNAEVVKAGGYLVIGVGTSAETHLVTKVVGKVSTLAYPLVSTHPAKAAVTGLTSHAFSLLNNELAEGNQPPACTLTDFAGEENWRQLAAAQLSSLTISGTPESLPKVVVDWYANAAIKPSPEPKPSFSSAEAPPGWTVQTSIGGAQIGYLASWEFALKRNVKNVPAITGTQAFYQHFAGPLDPTAKIVVLEDPKATWLTEYENGTLESIDLTLYDVASGFAANFHSTKAKFTGADLDRSKEWVEVPLEVQLLPSEADALAGGVSPIVVTVANNVPKTY